MSSVAPIFLPDEFNAASYFVDRHIEDGRADKVAIECGQVHVTYRQLFERVNQVGNGLRTLGVRIEERVILLLLDSPEFATSFFGAIKIGAVPVPLNTLLKSADYEYLLNDSRARVAIVSDSLVAAIEAIPERATALSRNRHRGRWRVSDRHPVIRKTGAREFFRAPGGVKQQGRCCLLALLFGNDRAAESLRSSAT